MNLTREEVSCEGLHSIMEKGLGFSLDMVVA